MTACPSTKAVPCCTCWSRANSTVDFRQYPMEFSEPAGTDLLVLTAYDRPFDLRRVAEALGMNRPADASPDGVGIFRMPSK